MQINVDQPLLFSSDWRNFIGHGIPFFNPGPDATGPNSGPNGVTLGNPEGALTFHTPLDNLVTMNRLTGDPAGGLAFSEGWAKGMEMCAQMLAWGMLQHDQGGAQSVNREVVAYYEALPNEAFRYEPITFDASGSYQYSSTSTRTRVNEDDLEFRWDFGDGTPTAYGKVVQHAYTGLGSFGSRLTVENVKTGAKDTMTTLITVENGALKPGGSFPLGTPKTKCRRGNAFVSARVSRRGRGLGFDFQRSGDLVVTADVVQAAAGRRALGKPRVVRRFKVTEPFAWNGALKRGRLPDGIYEARVTGKAGTRRDTRRFAFERRGGRFRSLKPVALTEGCGAVSAFALSSPAFGAKAPLRISVVAGKKTTVRVSVKRGSRTVKRFTRAARKGRTLSFRLSGGGLARGEYSVVLSAAGQKRTLYARRLS